MSSSVYEIELKALLTAQQYEELLIRLPRDMKLLSQDNTHITRFRPGDIRLRHSEKVHEIVIKEGDPTLVSRKETTIPLASLEELERLRKVLLALDFKPDPDWTITKSEFSHHYKGYEYKLSLQHIPKFADILEVEFTSDKDDRQIHEQHLRDIFKHLGCEPIEPEDFKRRINEYIKDHQK